MCDPVESEQYGYEIGGVLVTDFITPDWYAHAHSQGQIDLKGHANAAFQVLSGGYAQKLDPNQGWIQVTGAKALTTARGRQAPTGSRRERRARQRRDWEKSKPDWR